MVRYIGGFITKNKIEPTGAYSDDTASGVWRLNTVYGFRLENRWPQDLISSTTAFTAGGTWSSSQRNFIEFQSISSTGDGTDFGDLITTEQNPVGGSSATRGCFGPAWLNDNLEYITFSSKGNSTDTGNSATLGRGGAGGGGSVSNGVHYFPAGGRGSSSSPDTNSQGYTDVIEKVGIATLGNGVDFGDLTQIRGFNASASNTTRGIYAGGGALDSGWTAYNIMDYITMSSSGNAVDFGDLTDVWYNNGASASATRMVMAGGTNGSSNTDEIAYVTIASTGNTTDFGDLQNARKELSSCGSTTRGLFLGGYTTTNVDTIDYIEFASTGDASDFGDMLYPVYKRGSISNCHGGLS